MKFLIILTLVFFSTHTSAHAEEMIDPSTPVLTAEVATDGSEAWESTITGQVRNSEGKEMPEVGLVYNGVEYFTDAQGRFTIPANFGSGALMVKKAGYRKVSIQPRQGTIDLTLEPIEIKSLYMQSGMIKGQTAAFKNAMDLIRRTELNALTIDFKDDDGHVSTGLKPYIDQLHANGVYAIARVVSFKDNQEPRKHPELALTNGSTGRPWEDKKHVTYLNPFNTGAWDYLISVATAAADAGFDEVQFDYVRFPTDGDRSSIQWSTAKFTSDSRSAAIAGFLSHARKVLGARGVFIAADVFGITAFDSNDSGIGQQIEKIAPYLDYVCPMVYPSGYAKNTGGVKDPVAQPKEIVETSIRRYRIRADKVNKELVIRPWLQSFRDYSGSHRDYGGTEIRDQIDGSDQSGGFGFLLWNAASRYSDAGLKPKTNKKVLP